MSEQEKIENPSFHVCKGYLKVYDYKEAFKRSWDSASDEDRALLFKLPNFDAKVFKEISGIDVYEKSEDTIEIDGKKFTLSEIKQLLEVFKKL